VDKFCESCAVPLSGDFKGPSENYCKHCTDEKGNLHPREAVRRGIAKWFQSWQPGITEKQAKARAENYMQAMPAWAKD
jgi:hypothetical protein